MNQVVRHLFWDHGLRCTAQRVALYQALSESDSHPTADELYELVRRQRPGLSLATVYNTLEALCRSGLARRLPVTRGSVRYDADLRPHLHALDENTGESCDVPEDLGRQLLAHIPGEVIARIEERIGMRINRVSMQLLGERTSDNGHSSSPPRASS